MLIFMLGIAELRYESKFIGNKEQLILTSFKQSQIIKSYQIRLNSYYMVGGDGEMGRWGDWEIGRWRD